MENSLKLWRLVVTKWYLNWSLIFKDYKKNPLRFGPTNSKELEDVLDQIKEANVDESTTFTETCEKVNKIIDSASKEVQEQIKFLKKDNCSKSVLDQYLENHKDAKKDK